MVGALVYVTGVTGAGKSSVRRELRRRGLVALGMDEDEIDAFFGPDGEPVAPHDIIDSAPWRREHQWKAIAKRTDTSASLNDVRDLRHEFQRGAADGLRAELNRLLAT